MIKKSFNVYYLLLSEGPTEFNLFGYLTTKKFRDIFSKSKTKFSIKVDIVDVGISQGKINGVGSYGGFKGKYDLVKDDSRYKGEKIFFVLDKDLDESELIEQDIKSRGDLVQFVVHNSEYLLLRFAGKKLKEPTEFKALIDFRTYCKDEFLKHFSKEAPQFKDEDFDLIFSSVSEEEIRESFKELFSTII